jgi:hypothetical protein
MRKVSGVLAGMTTVILIGSFAFFSAHSQVQGRFDSCTLKLFDSSLRGTGSRTITVSNLDNSLPNGVQRVAFPDLAAGGINFSKRTHAYTFTCQGRNGKPQSNVYFTMEQFCEDVNYTKNCYAHTANSVVTRISEKKNDDIYRLSKASFIVPGRNTYSSFSALIIPR